MIGVPEFNRKTEQDKGDRKGKFYWELALSSTI
jgi:hypothetical protein